MILETRINEYNIKQKPKPKKDYAGIGAIIFTFTVLSIVIALSIYTAWQIAYGQSTANVTGGTAEKELYKKMFESCFVSEWSNLVVVKIDSIDCGFAYSDAINSKLLEGFTIKGIDNGLVFMEKIK
jgi:hypothetical protein